MAYWRSGRGVGWENCCKCDGSMSSMHVSGIDNEQVYLSNGTLQCPRDVPQRVMLLTIIYGRSHA